MKEEIENIKASIVQKDFSLSIKNVILCLKCRKYARSRNLNFAK